MPPTDPIYTAALAFIGVLLGALISAFTNYALAGRKEAAEKVKEARAKRTEILTAVRMIRLELVVIRSLLAAAKNSTKIERIELIKPLVTREAWEKFNLILAGIMSYDEWHRLSLAYQSISVLPLVETTEASKTIETLQQRVQEAEKVLKNFARLSGHIEYKDRDGPDK